jgi:hypothetical protein
MNRVLLVNSTRMHKRVSWHGIPILDHSPFCDRADYICEYRDQELFGFICLIYSGEMASILQMLAKASHQGKRPANALIAKTVELCEAKGLSKFDSGNVQPWEQKTQLVEGIQGTIWT